MGVNERIEQWANSQYGSAIQSLKDWWYNRTHHGCFCGAGNRCDTPVDGLDTCCQTHDAAYGSADVTSDTMWEIPDGFTKARTADADLVACAKGAQTDATEFRENLVWLFENRIVIADALMRFQRFRDWLLSEAPHQDAGARQAAYAMYAADLSQMGVGNDVLAGALADEGVSLTDHTA